jgi:AraC family transcriptional regulator
MNGARRPIPLTEIGRIVHLSPGRVQRVFSRIVGESPDRYQRRVRLDRAAELLTTTDRAIIDIAFLVGFGSHEAFTRAFRLRYRTTPRQYRNGAPSLSEVATVSPCVGLYRRPLSMPTEEFQMHYEITTREQDPTPVLFMSRRVDRDRFAAVLAEVLPAVFNYVMEQGLAMAGPPYVRYLGQSAAFFDIEAGMPLVETPKPPEQDTGILSGELPGGMVAATIHRGPYDSLGEAHAALDRWMADNDLSAAGPPWESYLTDPGEVPDPKDWETELLWPVA